MDREATGLAAAACPASAGYQRRHLSNFVSTAPCNAGRYRSKADMLAMAASKFVGICSMHGDEVQSECRFLIGSDVSAESSFWLEVGDLSDIIMIMTPEEFNENLKVEFHAQQGHAADDPSSRG